MPVQRFSIDLTGGPPPTQVAITGTNSAQDYTFVGPITGHTHTGRLYLPEQAGYVAASETLYPVIMAEHGKGGTPSTTETALLADLKAGMTAGDCPGTILLMPSNNDGSGNPAWGRDSFDSAWKAESMRTLELFAWVNQKTRANPARWCLTGFSMGAWTTFGLLCKWLAAVTPGAPRPHFKAVSLFAMPNANANGTTNWATGDNADFVRTFSSNAAYLATCSPVASTAGTGRAETYLDRINAANALAPLWGSAPNQKRSVIRLVKSAADNVSLTSMNELDARLTALGIEHVFEDLVTPTHNMGLYYTADARNWLRFLAPFLTGTA